MLSISIVTPSLDQGMYLEEALLSVLDQEYPRLEYVVADGGSTDGSVAVLQRYGARLTEWWAEQDGGPAAAVNAAFERTSGEAMAWLNADDRLLPGALGVVGEIFERHPEIEWLTTGYPGLMDEAGRIVFVGRVEGYHRTPYRLGLNGDLFPWSQYYFLQQESTFWRRSLWERAGPLDPAFEPAADFELWLRFFEHAEVYTVDTLLGAFRSHQGQRTAAQMDRYRERARAALRKHGAEPARPGLRHAARAVLPRPFTRAAAGGWSTPFVRWDRRSRSWATGRRRIG